MQPTPAPQPDDGRDEAAATAPALEAERDALRIQAAAVVAQQAALTEEELRLLQRRGGLERQEEQLAKHLEEKRLLLVEQREQIRAERDAIKEERAGAERILAARHREAEQAFAEADAERKLSQTERARFIELRKRLKRRWEEHFSAHEKELARREDELNTAVDQLDSEAGALERERLALSEQRLQHNGAMELGRRQLEQSWEELSLSQQDWEACLNREKTEYDQRARELSEREQEVAHREQALADEQRGWERVKATREQEAAGLEARIRNQRQKLQALEQAAVAALPPTPNLVEAVAPVNRVEAPIVLTRLAGCLADQRLHLLEQWRGVLDVQDHWQKQREEVLAELEDSSQRQNERERQLTERENQLSAWAAQLEQRQELLAQLRCSLEGRQARLSASAQEWEAERERVLAGAKVCEESAAARVRRLLRLYHRTFKRQRADTEALQTARTRCEETRKQYAVLREECRARMTTLLRDQQALAGETLALERLRLEVLSKAENAAAAEKRLDRLRRQSQELVHEAEAELERERQALLEEAGKQEERDRLLRLDEEQVITLRRKLSKRQRKWDQRMTEAHDADLQRVQEMRLLLAQHERDVNQLRELRDEVERLAGLMMEESRDEKAPTIQAA